MIKRCDRADRARVLYRIDDNGVGIAYGDG
jgi:hypothetical protein